MKNWNDRQCHVTQFIGGIRRTQFPYVNQIPQTISRELFLAGLHLIFFTSISTTECLQGQCNGHKSNHSAWKFVFGFMRGVRRGLICASKKSTFLKKKNTLLLVANRGVVRETLMSSFGGWAKWTQMPPHGFFATLRRWLQCSLPPFGERRIATSTASYSTQRGDGPDSTRGRHWATCE